MLRRFTVCRITPHQTQPERDQIQDGDIGDVTHTRQINTKFPTENPKGTEYLGQTEV